VGELSQERQERERERERDFLRGGARSVVVVANTNSGTTDTISIMSIRSRSNVLRGSVTNGRVSSLASFMGSVSGVGTEVSSLSLETLIRDDTSFTLCEAKRKRRGKTEEGKGEIGEKWDDIRMLEGVDC